MAAELWATGSTAEWTGALESYETAMDAKDAQRNKPADEKKKAKEGYQTLKERDDWCVPPHALSCTKTRPILNARVQAHAQPEPHHTTTTLAFTLLATTLHTHPV
jgi:hypothetical protein